jgi:hypothetical protein
MADRTNASINHALKQQERIRKLIEKRQTAQKTEIHIMFGGSDHCSLCGGRCKTLDMDDSEVRRVNTVWGRGGSASERWKDSAETEQES